MSSRGIMIACVGLLLTSYTQMSFSQTADQAEQLNEIQQKTRFSAADALRRAREVAAKVKENKDAGLAEAAKVDAATNAKAPAAVPETNPKAPAAKSAAARTAPVVGQVPKAVPAPPPEAPAPQSVPVKPIANAPGVPATIPSATIPSATIPSATIPSATIPSATIPSATIPSATTAVTPPTQVEAEEFSSEDISLQPAEQISKGIDLEQSAIADELISVSLDDVPLKDVVRMFSRISNANIIATEALESHRVTVNLQDVGWQVAMNAILDQSGFVMVEKHPSIYTVISKSALAAEPVEVETIILDYITVSNAIPVVRQMLVSTNSSVTPLVAANALIVRETAQQINAIKDVIAIIDKPRPQVFIEAKFVELNDQAIENIGVNWEVLQGYTVGASSLTRDYTDNRRRVEQNSKVAFKSRENTDESESINDRSTTSGEAATFNKADSINNSLSNLRTSLETRTTNGGGTESSTSANNSASIDSRNTLNGRIRNTSVVDAVLSGLNFDQATVSGDSVNITPSTPRDRLDIRTAVLSAEDFSLTLSALKEMDGVQIVSNPKLLVANGERATIHVGRNEPNIEAVPQGDTGDRFAYKLNSSMPFIEIGVKLTVIPTINTEDNVTLKINPELSRLLGEKTVGEANTSFPITQIRKIQTEFNVESGKTVAIGGLTETSDNEVIKKVPVLGDIPIIGKYLFTHTHTEQFQDEVIIFVSVELGNPPEMEANSGVPQGSRLIHQWLDKQEEKATAAKADKVDDRTVDEILADLRKKGN
jgi:type II secretory pathway component GspD/PulD (secretin)